MVKTRRTAGSEADPPAPICLLFTCEHGGKRVPARYAACFHQAGETLASHRGFDAGTLELGRWLARRFQAPLIAATVTRLLVDLNRSLGHRILFSEFTASLDSPTKRAILDRYYFPHRRRVEAAIAAGIDRGARAVHVGLHSFTPLLHGRIRHADIGLLYDPARKHEQSLCRQWQAELVRQLPDLTVRRNYPYLGKSDGFTTALRRRFPADRYLGIELEVKQCWTQRSASDRRRLACALAESLSAAIRGMQG